ncbi:hypothetical protein ELI_3689 [Eubacterium callanderi]|uniref:Uncharacterized protein n=1 Tax=Eubacterium callanderi TaxID=53442 RepID=E3GPR6_9FIRM|nr:hypothetical protein ELI_3689 [Eubacterium callanderi]
MHKKYAVYLWKVLKMAVLSHFYFGIDLALYKIAIHFAEAYC